jgi:hypothetical protein
MPAVAQYTRRPLTTIDSHPETPQHTYKSEGFKTYSAQNEKNRTYVPFLKTISSMGSVQSHDTGVYVGGCAHKQHLQEMQRGHTCHTRTHMYDNTLLACYTLVCAHTCTETQRQDTYGARSACRCTSRFIVHARALATRATPSRTSMTPKKHTRISTVPGLSSCH